MIICFYFTKTERKKSLVKFNGYSSISSEPEELVRWLSRTNRFLNRERIFFFQVVSLNLFMMVMAEKNLVDIRNGRRSRCSSPNESDDSSDDSDHGELSSLSCWHCYTFRMLGEINDLKRIQFKIISLITCFVTRFLSFIYSFIYAYFSRFSISYIIINEFVLILRLINIKGR